MQRHGDGDRLRARSEDISLLNSHSFLITFFYLEAATAVLRFAWPVTSRGHIHSLSMIHMTYHS